jgi:hypothetical protein
MVTPPNGLHNVGVVSDLVRVPPATPRRTAPVMAVPQFRASGDIALLRDRQLGGAVSLRHTGGDPSVTRKMLIYSGFSR